MVTIITVTYNSAKYISAAIDSILASTYTNFELIIGDDNSKDNTWQIVNTYTDNRIVKYKNETNIGEYPNRNKAINLAKGEYLIFIDGDDMIYPHGLLFMTQMLHSFPNCAMALMRWFKNNIFYPIEITPNDFYVGEYFGEGFLGTSFANTLFNTKVLKESGSLSSVYKSGDDFIRYKIAQNHNILIIADQLTWWRETPGQASQNLSNSINGLIESYEMRFAFLNNNCPLAPNQIEKAINNLNVNLGKILLKKIIKLKFSDARAVYKNFKPPVKFIFNTTLNYTYLNPFEKYSPENPKRENFTIVNLAN